MPGIGYAGGAPGFREGPYQDVNAARAAPGAGPGGATMPQYGGGGMATPGQGMPQFGQQPGIPPGLMQLLQMLQSQQGGGQQGLPGGAPMGQGGQMPGQWGQQPGSGMSPDLMRMFQQRQQPGGMPGQQPMGGGGQQDMMQRFLQMMMQGAGRGGKPFEMGGPPGYQGPGQAGAEVGYGSGQPWGQPQGGGMATAGQGMQPGSWMNGLFPGGGPAMPAGGGASPPVMPSMGNASSMSFTPR